MLCRPILALGLVGLLLASITPVTIHSVFDSDSGGIAEYNETTGAPICGYGWEAGSVIEGGAVDFVRADHIARPVYAADATCTPGNSCGSFG
jgi:hypothetical protein